METVELADSTGRVSGKYVMIYPPGVPILVPGEKYSKKQWKISVNIYIMDIMYLDCPVIRLSF